MAGQAKTTIAKRSLALIAVMLLGCGLFSWQLHQSQHIDQLNQVCHCQLLSQTVAVSLILLSVFLSLYPWFLTANFLVTICTRQQSWSSG